MSGHEKAIVIIIVLAVLLLFIIPACADALCYGNTCKPIEPDYFECD